MITFLHGADDYRRLEEKRRIIADFRKEHSALALGLFDFEKEGEAGRFSEFARSESLFENVKLAVIESAFEEAFETIDPEKFAKLLRPALDEKNMTVLISERGKPVKALAFLLAPPASVEAFEPLKGPAWIAFIKAEAKKLGVALADSAASFLGAVYGGNSWALVTELQKLASLKTAIEKKDLDALDLEARPDYWTLLNGMKSYDGKTRLYTLERLFALNDPPPRIFNILAAQTGEKTPRMAEYDLAIKSGRMDYEEALLDLAVS